MKGDAGAWRDLFSATMRVKSLCLFLFLVGCAPAPDRVELPELKFGEQYAPARARLITAGWKPVPARCSPASMCWGDDYPEMATTMDTGATCSQFTKGPARIEVCLKIILDGANVRSVILTR